MMGWCEWDGMMGNEGGRLELLYRLCGLEELWAENNGVFEGWTWTLHVLCKARALIAFWATMSMPGCINPLVQVGGTVLILLSSHERHCSTLGKWFKIYMSTWGCLKIWLDSLDFSKHFRFLGLVSRFLPSTFQVPSTIRRFRSRRFPQRRSGVSLPFAADRGRPLGPLIAPKSSSVKPGLEKGDFRSVQCWFGIPHLSMTSPEEWDDPQSENVLPIGCLFRAPEAMATAPSTFKTIWSSETTRAQCRIWVASRMGVLLYYAILYPQSHHGNSMGTPLWLGFGTSFFDRHPIHRLIIIPTNNAANDGYT